MISAPCIHVCVYVHIYVSVDMERYNCLMPVMNTMLEKCEHMLNISAHLPNVPHSDSNPAFCDDFRSYLQSQEWQMFMKKQASCMCCLCSANVALYTVSQKNDTDVARYNFNAHQPILIK